MSDLTLKDILDTVLLESGVATESSYAASTDDAVKRLVNLANRASDSLSRHPWRALLRTHEVSVTTATEYALPADWRYYVPDTAYTDSRLWGVELPTTASEWHFLQASESGTGPVVKMRILDTKFEIYEPQSGDQLQMEYVTKYAVEAADGTRKRRFTADTDKTLMDEDLLTMDILWRYKKLVGQDWQSDKLEFEQLKQKAWGQDGGARSHRPGVELDTTPYYDLWRPVPNSNP